VHSLGLHFIGERSAYCRLDSEGDLEEVIRVFHDAGTSDFDRMRTLVLIKAKPLAEFMAVGGYGLCRKFDLTRFVPGSFSQWEKAERHFDAPDLFYDTAVSDGNASYIHGHQILRPKVTVEELIEEWKREDDPNAREYETFKIHDWKNDKLVEWSCAPSELGNYFTKSDKPFEISPAFFSPNVLTKYKADPDKYDLGDRSITCRNAWHLKTFDIMRLARFTLILVISRICRSRSSSTGSCTMSGPRVLSRSEHSTRTLKENGLPSMIRCNPCDMRFRRWIVMPHLGGAHADRRCAIECTIL
jgi:hypothetical protein